MRNFCRNYASTFNSQTQSVTYQSTVVDKALETVRDCIAYARNGNSIIHHILDDEKANIDLTPATGNPMTIAGVSITGPVSCNSNTGEQKVTDFTQETRYQFSSHLTLSCIRKNRLIPTGQGVDALRPAATLNTPPTDSRIYDEATVTVSTENNLSYAFLWPRSLQLPENEAASIQQTIVSLQKNIEEANRSIPIVADGAAGKVHIECETVQSNGNIAACRPDFTPVACASGKNFGSSFSIGVAGSEQKCTQQNPNVDWTAARCCHVVFGP
jgi:hypothetical protein